MKKLAVIASALLLSCIASAESSQETVDKDKLVEIVDQRMSEKNINQVLQIALNTQMECQQVVDLDVCEGASTLVQVLDKRISEIPEASNMETVAFLKGVLAGVSKANKESLSKFNSLY